MEGALPVPLRVVVPSVVVAVSEADPGAVTNNIRHRGSVGPTLRAVRAAVAGGGGPGERPLPAKRMPIGNKVVPLAVLALAITFPFWWDHMFTIPIFGAFPSVATAVVMVVFIMMAVGLNVVVGYAGLLDLGYVAFYAMGAYTAAWFASLQFPQKTFHLGAIGIDPHLPGIHITIWALLIAAAGVTTALIGVVIGLPTLRLRGDYLAIVTLGFGEIMPQIARNGNDLGGIQPHRRPAGDHAGRHAGLRQPPFRLDRRLSYPRTT